MKMKIIGKFSTMQEAMEVEAIAEIAKYSEHIRNMDKKVIE